MPESPDTVGSEHDEGARALLTTFALADDGIYAHPLLVGDVDPRVAERLAAGDIEGTLHDVVIYSETIENEDGSFEQRSVVSLPERTVLDPHRQSRDEVAELGGEVALDSTVARWIAEPQLAGPSARVWVSFDVGDRVPVMRRLVEAIAKGEVLTDDDAWAFRQGAARSRRVDNLEFMATGLADLRSMGADIIDIVPSADEALIEIDPAFLTEASSAADIVALSAAADMDINDYGGDGIGTDVYGTNIDGYEMADLVQAQQFYDAGYFGGGNEVITLSETDGDNVRRSHVGYDDLGGVDRFTNCTGTGSKCDSNPNPSVGASHAAGTSSLLLGDITRGLDSSIICSPTTHNCAMRSGVARRTKGLGVDSNNWSHVDWAATTNSYILTMSAGGDDDPDCSGDESRSRSWNAMYEDGVALFNSNGNNGHTSSTDCTMNNPSTAMGVFAVAAYDTDPGNTPAHAPIIRVSTSRGGTASEGVRPIYAMAGPNNRLYSYEEDASASPQYKTTVFNASSAATPIVAGSAALYREWFLDVNGTQIDDPGFLYAEMLLMGDRRSSDSGTKLSEGYSNLWGAGALRLRKYDSAGMDAPAQHSAGSVCVDDGAQVIPLELTTPISASVDYAKAVIWYYDPSHDNIVGGGNGDFDRVELDLQYFDTGTSLWTTLRDDEDDNNMRRVWYTDPGAWKLRIRLTGTDVTNDDTGCGTNSMLVYWAYLHEDNARDDDTALTESVRPEF